MATGIFFHADSENLETVKFSAERKEREHSLPGVRDSYVVLTVEAGRDTLHVFLTRMQAVLLRDALVQPWVRDHGARAFEAPAIRDAIEATEINPAIEKALNEKIVEATIKAAVEND